MSKKILYFECYSGISGDMIVAALLDLGVNRDRLQLALDSIPIDGFKTVIGRSKKNGIDACDFDVILTDETKECHHAGHVHRTIGDIYLIIEGSDITDGAKALAKKIFLIVAQAESKAHGVAVDQVHFHEVGAVDSIVDIVAAAVCLEDLGCEEVVVSSLSEGSGHVHCQHGTLPVPVPAVINIVAEYGLCMNITDNKGEMITPTGVAVVAAAKTMDKLPLNYKLLKVGLGAGKKDFEKANLLRVFLLEDVDAKTGEDVWVIEANIDDCSGEALGFTMEQLLEMGAMDVFYTPIYMKKNRPAYKLSVICTECGIADMEGMIFRHTTTIGVRKYKASRRVLSREILDIMTPFGPARVKRAEYKGDQMVYPEYEDIKRLCIHSGSSFQDTYDMVKEIGKGWKNGR